jgi:hypothetical protein
MVAEGDTDEVRIDGHVAAYRWLPESDVAPVTGRRVPA